MRLKRYFYLYETTNLINGMVYAGAHSTNNLDDGYLGSGKRLKAAIKEYGKEKFKKEIISFFNNEGDLFEAEENYIDEAYVSRLDTYNIVQGGKIGKGINYLGSEKFLWLVENDTTWFENFKLKSKQGFKKYINSLTEEERLEFKRSSEKGRLKALSEESKKKRIKTLKEIKHQQGERNSQYGKMWITDGINSTRIYKYDIIPEGWKKGRIIKNKK